MLKQLQHTLQCVVTAVAIHFNVLKTCNKYIYIYIYIFKHIRTGNYQKVYSDQLISYDIKPVNVTIINIIGHRRGNIDIFLQLYL